MPKSDVKIHFFDETETERFYVLQHHVGHNIVGHKYAIFGQSQYTVTLYHPAVSDMRFGHLQGILPILWCQCQKRLK